MPGQNQRPISAEEFINKVKTNNIGIKKSQKDILKAKADYIAAKAVFLPNIKATHTALLTTNPLVAFGSRLNQGILTANDFDPSLLNNPRETRNVATVFQIEQPIINMDGFFERKAAQDNFKATSFQVSRTQDYVILEAQRAYMDLQFAYQQIEVLEKAMLLNQKLHKQTLDFYEEGMIQKSELLLVNIRVLELQNQLKSAKSQIKNLSQYLSFLMNEEKNTVLKPIDSLIKQTALITPDATVLTERADIRALELASKARKKILKSKKMGYLPRLNAFGSYELYDNQLFNGMSSGYVVGAQLSWDLFKGGSRIGKIQKAKVEYEQTLLQSEEYLAQSNLELSKTQRLLKDLENELELKKLSLEQAEEVLRIKLNRLEEGLEKMSDVLAAETELANKNLNYYQTVYQYNHTNNYLQFLTKKE